ncbi:MAG TPA: lysoplasmalogenase [Ktedonobacterales bacterium]|nr:lysoplasmalogenase [Ktedonobacterales bacterium]
MFAVDNAAALSWLLALLAIWAALLIGSVIAQWTSHSEHNKPATRLRLASSAILVIAAWSWYLTTRDTPRVAEFALLVALGMTFGFLGDLLLAEILPLRQSFLAGIGAFAVGHIAYISAILSVTAHVQWMVEGIALLIGLAGWYLVVLRNPDAGLLRWAALPYALLLATTAGLAAGLATQAGVFVPLAVGAALFLISDLLVAGERFGGMRFPHVHDAIWLTYGPAQMLIVYTVNSALVVAGR